jgi:hypothetical protein
LARSTARPVRATEIPAERLAGLLLLTDGQHNAAAAVEQVLAAGGGRDLVGIYAGDRMVGLYSPRDVLFSLTPYEACGCRGYKTEDAAAVATNIVLYLTTLK